MIKDLKEKNIKWWIGTGSCVLLFVFIGIFVYAKMNFIWRGVQLDAILERTDNPKIVTIKGNAEKAVHLTINGREIFIDKEGNFTEVVSPLPGYSVITLFAKDKFGKTAEKKFELYTNEEKLAEEIIEDTSAIVSEELVEVPPNEGQATSEEILLENNY